MDEVFSGGGDLGGGIADVGEAEPLGWQVAEFGDAGGRAGEVEQVDNEEPVVPSGAGRRGRPWNDHRLTLEAIAWRFRTGAPWRDLSAEFGAWQSVWERHRRWSVDGTDQEMLAAVLAAANSRRR